MKRSSIVTALALGLVCTTPAFAAPSGGKDPAAVMKFLPAKAPLSGVVISFTELDKSIEAFMRRLDPQYDEPGILAQFKAELPVAAWADLDQPMGFTFLDMSGAQNGLLFMRVPDFAARIKELPNAQEANGIWTIGDDESVALHAKALPDDYVVVGMGATPEQLAQAGVQENSLAFEMKSRMDLLKGRDAVIHVNADAYRPMVLQQITQAAQMAPMMAMMMAQGGDPMGAVGALAAALDAAKAFAEQVAYVDLAFRMDTDVAHLTIATGYRDGAIKAFITQAKPAGMKMFTEVEDQPYFMAAASHVPGGMGEFYDFLLASFTRGVNSTPLGAPPPTADQPGATDQGDGKAEMIESFKLALEMNKLTEGGHMVMSFAGEGMKMVGDYVTTDPQQYMALLKKSEASAGSMMQQFGGGMKLESLGSSTISGVAVEKFKLAMQTPPQTGAMMPSFMTGEFLYGAGVVGKRVRFCMGGEQDLEQAFKAKVAKPLAGSERIKSALAALPEKRNVVLLIDPAGLLPMLSTMLPGMVPPMPAMGPCEPFALSVSLCGEPARVDIQVPLKTIEQIVQSMQPPAPPEPQQPQEPPQQTTP
jgi:hypothetical protein